ncbi:MAG: hypothetical protein H6974_09355 [Gammaproteobacteria bacterium]|nr:hypothetical protein [Gammaproteobacteria bacterium]
MSLNLADDIRAERLQLLADHISGGVLTLYTAPRPAIGAAITTQTALVTVDIPGGLTVVDHLLTLSLAVETILAEGLADWGRITRADTSFAVDGDCGLLASEAGFRLKTLSLVATGQLIPIIATFAEA